MLISACPGAELSPQGAGFPSWIGLHGRKGSVVALQQKVDAEKSEEDDAKTDDGHDRRPSSSPPDGQPFVKQCRVKQPADGGPDLLGSQLQNLPQMALA